jgi:uncharacterized protein DUF6665
MNRRITILASTDALDHEFAQERAATLGRLGRALEVALSALSQINSPKQDRERLVEEASLALWHFVVQREACGLRDFAYVVRDYRVPREVAARMGAMPSGSLKRRAARMSVSDMRE